MKMKAEEWQHWEKTKYFSSALKKEEVTDEKDRFIFKYLTGPTT